MTYTLIVINVILYWKKKNNFLAYTLLFLPNSLVLLYVWIKKKEHKMKAVKHCTSRLTSSSNGLDYSIMGMKILAMYKWPIKISEEQLYFVQKWWRIKWTARGVQRNQSPSSGLTLKLMGSLGWWWIWRCHWCFANRAPVL